MVREGERVVLEFESAELVIDDLPDNLIGCHFGEIQ